VINSRDSKAPRYTTARTQPACLAKHRRPNKTDQGGLKAQGLTWGPCAPFSPGLRVAAILARSGSSNSPHSCTSCAHVGTASCKAAPIEGRTVRERISVSNLRKGDPGSGLTRERFSASTLWGEEQGWRCYLIGSSQGSQQGRKKKGDVTHLDWAHDTISSIATRVILNPPEEGVAGEERLEDHIPEARVARVHEAPAGQGTHGGLRPGPPVRGESHM
jgi:hypothetical protein